MSLFDAYRGGATLSITKVFRLLLLEKFSGQVTFHFQGGYPRKMEMGKPDQFPVCLDELNSAAVLEQREVFLDKQDMSLRR